MSNSHYFTGGGPILHGQAILLVKIGKEPEEYKKYMRFDIAKDKSEYNGILGQLVLKWANIVISIHHAHERYPMNRDEMSLKYNQ